MLAQRVRYARTADVRPVLVVFWYVHVTCHVTVGEKPTLEAERHGLCAIERVRPVNTEAAAAILVAMKRAYGDAPLAEDRS